ncbi:MAG: acetyltransferase, partial [Gammaproteobacteria bacterium SG8_11]
MKTYYGLIGAGGHGREVMPLLRSILNKQLPLGEVELLFVVEELTASEIVNGYKVISLIDFIDLPGEKKFNIAIGDSIVRARLAKICLDNKIEAFTICADSAVILDENEIGIGCMLSSFTTITSNVKIGKFFQANSYCNIAHDCVIGD